MALAEFAFLLGDLASAFGEPVQWQGATFPGRFRIDPFVVALPDIAGGIGVTETWLYCERAVIPGGRAPDIGSVLMIRGRGWEVTEVGEDDLGELALRLIKHEGPVPAEADQPQEQHRPPGRPTRREEIERAYQGLAGQIEPGAPLRRVIPAVRRAITGSAAPVPGLADKTLGKALGPLVAARRRPA